MVTKCFKNERFQGIHLLWSSSSSVYIADDNADAGTAVINIMMQ